MPCSPLLLWWTLNLYFHVSTGRDPLCSQDRSRLASPARQDEPLALGGFPCGVTLAPGSIERIEV